MIIRVHSECFQGLPHAGRVTVGDDVWHTKDRIARRLPRRQLPAKKALKQVFGWITAVGHYKPDSYSMDAWQQLCVEVFQYELEKWREEHRSISIKAKEAAIRAIEDAELLFKYMPWSEEFTAVGTTANEHGSYKLNRKTKFTSHMRGDNAWWLVAYVIWLGNGDRACVCAKEHHFSQERRSLLATLFQSPACHLAAEQGSAPYIWKYAVQREVYTWEQYVHEFGGC